MHPNLTTLPGHGTLVFACEICGESFRRNPSDRTHRFCSRTCWAAKPRQNPLAYWLANLNTTGEHWVWTGFQIKSGYGQFSVDGQKPSLTDLLLSKLWGVPSQMDSCLSTHATYPPVAETMMRARMKLAVCNT